MSQLPQEEITLASLLGGALEAQFQSALEEVVKNIDDPNTEAEAARTILVKITMKPTQTRASASLAVEVSAKLAGAKPMGSTAFFAFDRKAGRYVAREYNPDQKTIFEQGVSESPRVPVEKGEPS